MYDNKQEPILIAGVEGGGTTFVLSIAQLYPTQINTNCNCTHQTLNQTLFTQKIQILETTTISSANPTKTIKQCCMWLSSKRPHNSAFASVGIACFGPLGVDPNNPLTYGHILPSSPKQEWRNVDILTPIVQACSSSDSIPCVKLDTDVNAPAMAEFQSRVSGKSSLAYVTVGTGVGVGLIVNSKPVHGRMHPEGGHVCVSPLLQDVFQGYSWGKDQSPYKGVHTVEGIASSVALTERLEQSTSSTSASTSTDRNALALLPDTHEIWDHASNAIANLCCTMILLLSMEEIVLGGGIMKRTILYEKIRYKTLELLNGYVSVKDGHDGDESEEEAMRKMIRTPTWGDETGLVGALMLAKMAYEEEHDAN